MAGLLGDLIGNAALGGAAYMQEQIRNDFAMQRDAALESLRVANAPKLEEARYNAKSAADEAARVKRSAAVQEQLGANADADVSKKFYGVDALPDDATPEAKAAYDEGVGLINAAQSKARSDFMGNARNAAMAEAQAGYGDYEKVAALDNKADIQAAKSDAYIQIQEGKRDIDRMKLEMQGETNKAKLAQMSSELAIKQAKLDAQIQRWQDQSENKANPADKEMTKLRTYNDTLAKMVESGEVTIDRKTGVASGSGAATYNKFKALRDKLSDSIESSADSPAPGQPPSVKPPAPPAPIGMKLIGKTPDGRSVYQDANGKKYAQ